MREQKIVETSAIRCRMLAVDGEAPWSFCARRIRGGLKLSLLLAALATFLVLPVFADEQRVHDYSIQAQDLGAALKAFAFQSKREIFFAPEMTQGRHTHGVTGKYDDLSALEKILLDTGLTYTVTASKAILVTDPASHAKPISGTQSPETPSFARADGTASTNAQTFGATEEKSASGNSDRNAPNDTNLSEIVVTASKREEKAWAVPTALNVQTGAFLDQINASQLSDYIGYLPNVTLLSAAPGYAEIHIRGITNIGSGSTVGTYIDDAPFGSSTNFGRGGLLQPDIDPYDLQQIEVLKGPQGTLYGAGSEGGLIKYVVAAPDATQSSMGFTEVLTSMDQGDQGYSLRGHVNAPLVDNELALRVSAYYRKDPGFIDNIGTGQRNYNDDETKGLHATLLATPNDALSVRLSALYQSLTAYGLNAVPVDSPEASPAGSRGPPLYGPYINRMFNAQGNAVTDQLYTLGVDYKFAEATLSSITSYSRVKDLYGYGDGGYDNASYGVNPADTFANELATSTNKVSQELRLVSNAPGRFQWIAGLFYTHENSNSDTYTLADGADGQPDLSVANGVIYSSIVPTTYTEYSGFGNLTYYIKPDLDLTVGARYSDYQQSYSETNTGLFGNFANPTEPLVYPEVHSSQGTPTYLATLRQVLDNNGVLYLRAASGFRVGGPTVLPPGATPPPGYTGTFGAEKLYNYEIGYRQDYWGHRLSIDMDAFYIHFNDLQGNIQLGRYFITGNAGNATSRGFEISAQARPITGLSINAAAGYDDSTLNQDSATFGALRGDDLPYTPHLTANFNSSYERPLSGIWTGYGGGGVRYVSAQKGDFTHGFYATNFPAVTLVDLQLGVRRRAFTAELFVKNAANTYRYQNDASPSSNGPSFEQVTPPRMIGLKLSQSF